VALNDCGRLPSFSAVMLEYHSESDRTRISDMMESAGFKLHASKSHCPDRGELKFLKPVEAQRVIAA
jgi:hypothetical protein